MWRPRPPRMNISELQRMNILDLQELAGKLEVHDFAALRKQELIFAIIKRVNQEHGTTILLVEQNANMALKTGDYGYVLEAGRIVMEDSCERLREKEDIKEFYLGVRDAGVRGERRWKRKKLWR